MNKATILIFSILCVVLVNGRHFEDRRHTERTDDDEQIESRRQREHGAETKRRHRRWQMNYGYDYQPQSSYYPDRRSYDRNQDPIPEIFRLLDDLAAYVKKNQQQSPPPPPPPQPIYIPYPVPYPVPQYINCRQRDSVTNQTFPSRDSFPKMEDVNQNWGYPPPVNDDYEDDGSDGSRPISFDPINPKDFMKRPAPKTEHGSIQAQAKTQAPRVPLAQSVAPTEPKPVQPGACDAAILSCCGNMDELRQRECFSNIGCNREFSNGGCSMEAINRALNSFKAAYSSVD